MCPPLDSCWSGVSQSERESSQLVLDSVTFTPQWIHQDGRECARIGFFLVSGVGAETKERVCADGVCALSSEHRVCVREWLVIAMEVRNQAGEPRDGVSVAGRLCQGDRAPHTPPVNCTGVEHPGRGGRCVVEPGPLHVYRFELDREVVCARDCCHVLKYKSKPSPR